MADTADATDAFQKMAHVKRLNDQAECAGSRQLATVAQVTVGRATDKDAVYSMQIHRAAAAAVNVR